MKTISLQTISVIYRLNRKYITFCWESSGCE